MKVIFPCPNCDQPARLLVDRAQDWQCGYCEQRQEVAAADPALPVCVICGNPELYKKKDFPHGLGMTILVAACLGSIVTYFFYEPFWTWVILLGSALVDGVLYLLVGDAVVCYRCNAHYKGFTAKAVHAPFELTVGERYRQERIRREQLKAGKGPA